MKEPYWWTRIKECWNDPCTNDNGNVLTVLIGLVVVFVMSVAGAIVYVQEKRPVLSETVIAHHIVPAHNQGFIVGKAVGVRRVPEMLFLTVEKVYKGGHRETYDLRVSELDWSRFQDGDSIIEVKR